jgi:hypothetical protein
MGMKFSQAGGVSCNVLPCTMVAIDYNNLLCILQKTMRGVQRLQKICVLRKGKC